MAVLDALPEDFRDFLVAMADVNAEFVLVGGWAVAVHGRPRTTEDLDVFVRPTPENSERVYRALAAFGAPVHAHGLRPDVFSAGGYGYRFGIKPNLVEVLTTISGVDFDTALVERIVVHVDGRSIPVIGRPALVANKRAAARPKDLEDVRWLERHPSGPPRE
jgi:hypothetical protein